MNFKHLLAMTLIAGVALTGCSSTKEEPKTEEPTVEVGTETNTETTAFTGEAVSETPVADSTDVIVTTITYNEGQPTDLMIDVRTESGSKRELVASGNYDMGGELSWSEQLDALQKHIVENGFDLTTVTLTDADGHTDAISGVSMKIGDFLPAVEALMTSVKEGTYVAPTTEAVTEEATK